MNPPILVTGCAGFIGYHLTLRLLEEGYSVVGIDSLNDYYDVQLKRDRLQQLLDRGLLFQLMDVADSPSTLGLFRRHRFQKVVHLAAQAGVRYSKTNPHAYVSANLEGFLNILEAARDIELPHLIYASSSSVYGANRVLPFSTQDRTDHPVSLYGATKKANELMAHAYASMYGLASTGLRFFTVYGPWGRPDMALYVFARAILEDRPIELFNYGKMRRDFTFVDDVVHCLKLLLEKAFEPPAGAPARVFNVGNHNPVDLDYFVQLIEQNLEKKAEVRLEPLQAGDVVATFAETSELEAYLGFQPNTPLEVGIKKSLQWYLQYRHQQVV